MKTLWWCESAGKHIHVCMMVETNDLRHYESWAVLKSSMDDRKTNRDHLIYILQGLKIRMQERINCLHDWQVSAFGRMTLHESNTHYRCCKCGKERFKR